MLELLYKRRSIRKYKDILVEEEKINKIIEAALLAPSGRNLKPCEFVVVTNKEIIKKLAESKETGAQFVEGAPLVIAVLVDNKISNTWVEDASIALTFIQLMAGNLGLGSCWIQLKERKTKDGIDSETYVKELVGLNNNLRVEALVSIGYANEVKEPKVKENLDYNKVTWKK